MPHPVLTFTPQGLGVEVAKLGDRIVGQVLPSMGRRIRVAWFVRLTDWPVTEQVNEWLASIGWLDPGAGVTVRVPEQAEV